MFNVRVNDEKRKKPIQPTKQTNIYRIFWMQIAQEVSHRKCAAVSNYSIFYTVWLIIDTTNIRMQLAIYFRINQWYILASWQFVLKVTRINQTILADVESERASAVWLNMPFHWFAWHCHINWTYQVKWASFSNWKMQQKITNICVTY